MSMPCGKVPYKHCMKEGTTKKKENIKKWIVFLNMQHIENYLLLVSKFWKICFNF